MAHRLRPRGRRSTAFVEGVVLGYHEKRDCCPILTQVCCAWIPNLDFLFHENLFVDLFKRKWYNLATSLYNNTKFDLQLS